MSRLHLDCESRRQVGAPTRGQAQPRNPRNRLFRLFAILPQSSRQHFAILGLWMDCRFNAILTRFRRIASGLQPNAIDRPGIALPSQSDRNQSRNPRNCLFRLFAILPQSRNSILQSCGLWIDCIFKAILIQFGWIASGVAIKCQQLSQDCPTIAIREESDCNPP